MVFRCILTAVSTQVDLGDLVLEVAGRTDTGRARRHNEDHLGYHVPDDPRQRGRKGLLCLVADGMGGHQAGEVASRKAVELATRRYYADPGRDVRASLTRAFQAANRAIHKEAQADPTLAGMGTTLVGAVIAGHRVCVANVGDSRAYLVGGGGISQISDDHSWVEEQVRAGMLTAQQARQHPQRNLVTRALGSRPAVDVDLFEGTMAGGDVLLLCTDGLTNLLGDAEIEAIVRQQPLQAAAQSLVDLANERGGNDNITVLLVRAQGSQCALEATGRRAHVAREMRRLLPILVGVAVLLALLAVMLILPMLQR